MPQNIENEKLKADGLQAAGDGIAIARHWRDGLPSGSTLFIMSLLLMVALAIAGIEGVIGWPT